MDRFPAELGQKFKLKDMGDAGYYMGCHITRNHKERELKFDQHLYVESMVKTFDVKKTTKIPAASGVPSLPKADEPRSPEEKDEMRKFPYREAVGALMWTATMTRPDIACAVRAVARFCENPGTAQKKAVMKMFQYLLHTKEGGITYGGQGWLWTLHGSIHGLGFRSLPGHKTIGFGCAVDAGEGGDQLALKDARSDSIGYLGGRIRCLIRGGNESSIFETGAGVHETVDESRCRECVRR